MIKIEHEALRSFVVREQKKCDLDDFSTLSVSRGLIETSLRGVDSHGIRLLPHYAHSALKGRKNPRPNFEVTRKFPATILLDADNAFGHAAGFKAVSIGVEAANTFGMCSVTVKNSSHPGAMASFALEAARQDVVCFAFTHADSLILSKNGNRSFFGTNPICMAAPRVEDEPYCLDMATSVVPWNKILLAKDRGENLPAGVAADLKGNITADPNIASSLLPVGDYKGFALASMVEVLCSCFSGIGYARHIPAMYNAPINEPRGLGQFFMFMRADAISDNGQFQLHLQNLTDELRAEPPIDQLEVMAPGVPEIKTQKIRMRDGRPIDAKTLESLRELSNQFGLKLQ